MLVIQDVFLHQHLHYVCETHAKDWTDDPEAELDEEPGHLGAEGLEEDDGDSSEAADDHLRRAHRQRKDQDIDQDQSRAHLGCSEDDEAKTQIGDLADRNGLDNCLVQCEATHR